MGESPRQLIRGTRGLIPPVTPAGFPVQVFLPVCDQAVLNVSLTVNRCSVCFQLPTTFPPEGVAYLNVGESSKAAPDD